VHYTDLAPSFWQEHVQIYELTEIMRQKDAQEWARILNKLREGWNNLAKEDQDWLWLHLVKYWKFEDPQYPKLKPHQFSTNEQVDKHNQKFISYTQGDAVHIPATDRVSDWSSQKVGDGSVTSHILRQAAQVDTHKAKNLHALLRIKVGCRVEIGDTYDQAVQRV
jgi:hypothetical protein